MRFIVDRFEGAFAVCETEDGRSFDLPGRLLPGIGEGECVKVVPDGDITVLSADEETSVLAAEGIRAAVPAVLTEGFLQGDKIGFEIDEEYSSERMEKIGKLMDELFED